MSTSLLEVSRPHISQSEFSFISIGVCASHHTRFQKTSGCLLLVFKMHSSHVSNLLEIYSQSWVQNWNQFMQNCVFQSIWRGLEFCERSTLSFLSTISFQTKSVGAFYPAYCKLRTANRDTQRNFLPLSSTMLCLLFS